MLARRGDRGLGSADDLRGRAELGEETILDDDLIWAVVRDRERCWIASVTGTSSKRENSRHDANHVQPIHHPRADARGGYTVHQDQFSSLTEGTNS